MPTTGPVASEYALLLAALGQDLATLRGTLEVQTNDIAQTQRRQRELATELDTRIKRFEPVPVTIDGRQVNVDIAERRAYEAALGIFRSGDFRAAQTAFQQFQGAYPQSQYGALTAYWLGSSQYAQKDNRGALTTLQGDVQKYPEHARVPEALLIIGTCQADLGDRKEAADTYRTLNQQYPDSPAAASARERLAALNTAAAPTPPPTQPSAPAPAVTQPSPPAAPTAPAAPAAKPPTKR
jgi:tol-pal system protein YbgF